MDYVSPVGAVDPDASYVTGNPGGDIEGSPVDAKAIEHPMREIVAVIKEAGLEPSGGDLTQLSSAIKRMLGGFGRSIGFDTNRTITADQVNSHINIFGTCSAITLPKISEIPKGSVLFFCGCSLPCKISAAAGDLIFGNSGNNSLQSLTVENGGWLMFVSSKNSWFVSGTSALKFCDGFSFSATPNGYQKLPSGLIIQWGTTPVLGTAPVTVTFPIAFPTACSGVLLTNGTGASINVGVISRSAASFQGYASMGGNVHPYAAFGY